MVNKKGRELPALYFLQGVIYVRERRGFVAGFLTAVLAMSLVVGAQATVGKKTMTADYNNIKIELDGQQITPTDANGKAVEPFAVDGTTYLPVRAVSEALGVDVEWDGNTSTVKLSGSPSTLNKDSIQVMDIYKDLEDAIEYGQFILDSSSKMTVYAGDVDSGEIIKLFDKAIDEQIPAFTEQLDYISDNIKLIENSISDSYSIREINEFVKPLLEDSYDSAEKIKTAIYCMKYYVNNPTYETFNAYSETDMEAFNLLGDSHSSAFYGYERMYLNTLTNG